MFSAVRRAGKSLGRVRAVLYYARAAGSSAPLRQAQIPSVGLGHRSVSPVLPGFPHTSVAELPLHPASSRMAHVGEGPARAPAPPAIVSHEVVDESSEQAIPKPVTDSALSGSRDEFWRKVPLWKDVSAAEFLSYRWSVSSSRPYSRSGCLQRPLVGFGRCREAHVY